jgi:ATPase subunit of ABC transporter with duplicated ATPase domains
MSVLEAAGLAVEAGGTTILEDLSFSLRAGDKVGVVGRNGAGKTSLLKVLAGEAQPVRGTVTGRGALGYLRQDPRHRADQDHTALVHVLEARGLQEMAERLEKLRLTMEGRPTENAVGRYARLEERYRAAGGYSGEAEARRIVAGLGLSQDRLELPVRALSGGERRRLELARILFAGSDVLLLDEPTNHLDMRAKDVLLRALSDYTGTVVFVSHDRYFIDKLATRVFEVGDGKVEVYPGNYEDYRWRKEGGAAELQKAVTSATKLQPPNGANGNSSVPKPASEDSAGKRLNPIKRKQMEDRVHELEAEINRLEDAIAEYEAALQTFVSAEETQRLTQELSTTRSELQSRMGEWEQLGQVLQA